jgi:hypothetical protein
MLLAARKEVHIAVWLVSLQNRLLIEHLITYEGFIVPFVLSCDGKFLNSNSLYLKYFRKLKIS